MRVARLWLPLLAVLLCARVLEAQQGTSSIRGQVLDGQGAAAPGVSVAITHRDTGIFREVISEASGVYSVTNLAPGSYVVRAELAGFKRLVLENVVLTAGATQTQDLHLELGGLEESVTVSGQAPAVDLTSAAVGGNVSLSEVQAMPSIQHTVIGFLQVVPSVVYVPAAKASSDVVIINGQSDGNTYYMDGGPNHSQVVLTGNRVTMPAELVQEVQVVSVQVPAEYGGRKGAVINAITKQGTNQFRGSVYGAYSPQKLLAVDYLVKLNNLAAPDVSRKQLGFTLGGPIVRNKLFFFGSLERTPVGKSNVVAYPSRPDKNYTTEALVDAVTSFIRLDHQVTPNDFYAFRYLSRTGKATGSPAFRAGGADVPTGGSTLETLTNEWQDDKIVVATYNRVISDRKVNVFTFASPKQTMRTGVPENKSDVDGDDVAARAPTLRHPSFEEGVSYFNHWKVEPTYRLDNAFTWFVPGAKGGSHEFKFGGMYQYAYHHRVNKDAMNGIFVFPTDRAFNAADPSTYPESLIIRNEPSILHSTAHGLGFYVRDKWEPASDLTLTLGLRYDVMYPPVDNTQNPLFANRTGYNVDTSRIQPRVGFAYALNERKSVVRGGYGVYYQGPVFGSDVDRFNITGLYGTGTIVNFPASGVADPGPSAGRLPTDPFLVNGPVVNRALLNQLVPLGSVLLNSRSTVWLDNPDRKNLKAQQLSLGYEREFWPGAALNIDYVRTRETQVNVQYDLNPGLRATTSRTAPITRVDLLGLARQIGVPPFVTSVLTLRSDGEEEYDGLNVGFSVASAGRRGRISYTAARCRATTPVQVLDVVTQEWGLCAGRDRPHVVSVSGSFPVPRTGGLVVTGSLRAWSGQPFTLTDSTTDPNRNGSFTDDPLPAGTYAGTTSDSFRVENKGGFGGARSENFAETDVRFGYVFRLPQSRVLDVSADIFNLTNEPNFDVPVGDRRNTNFLRPTALVAGGIPRQVQLNVTLRF